MKKSIMTGAVILMTANIISKILGAVLKIPLTYIVHEEGMAVYNTSFNVYIMFLSFVVSGMPFAVQKLTAEAHAKSQPERACEIVRIATVVLTLLGIIGTAALWIGADFFALAMKEDLAGPAIRAIAPSVLLVALGTAVKSGFQGRSDMLPTAVSQVIESFIKLFAGYWLALRLLQRGMASAAAGASAGVTIGEAAATAMLCIWYMLSVRHTGKFSGSRREIFGALMAIALPLLFMSVVSSAVSVCDTSLLRKSLIKALGSRDEARFVYGSYTGYALTVLNLPAGFLATVGISLIPVISGASATGNIKRIRIITVRSLLFAGGAGLCAAAALFFFGEFILQLLFHNTASAPMLKLAAPSVLFICVMQISGAILQSMGCLWRTFVASLAAAAVKLLCSIFLASRPELNIYGAAIGTDIAFCLGMLINLWNLTVISKTA